MEIPNWRVEILQIHEDYEKLKEYELSESDYVKINTSELFRVLHDLKTELNIPSYKFDHYLISFKKILKKYNVRYANKYALRKAFRNYVSLIRFHKSKLTIK